MKWAVLCDFLWMAVYFGTFFLFVSALGVEGMAVAQLLASLVQMTAAIALARRERFFGGVGAGLGRLAAVLVVIAVCGMVVTSRIHLYGSIVFLLAAPFAARYAIAKLGVFTPGEKESILEPVTVKAGRRIAAWMLSAGEQR